MSEEEKSPRKPRSMRPETLKVVPLTRPPAPDAKPGRPKKREMPPLPKEIWEGMSELEREHFTYFVESVRAEYKDLTGTDLIFLNMAGLDYINTMRLQVAQLGTGELVTMSRQHPGVQFRAWIDMLSVSRKARQGTRGDEEKASQVEKLAKLWQPG